MWIVRKTIWRIFFYPKCSQKDNKIMRHDTKRKEVIILNVAETAKLINKAPQYVRLGLQQQRLPFRQCSTKTWWPMVIRHSRLQGLWVFREKGEWKQMNKFKELIIGTIYMWSPLVCCYIANAITNIILK